MRRRSRMAYSCSCRFVRAYWLMLQTINYTVTIMAAEEPAAQHQSKRFLLPDVSNPLQPLNVEAGVWSEFKSLVNAKKGGSKDAIAHLKQYFAQFGYLSLPQGTVFGGDFDDAAEAAIRAYQEWFGLPITGMLDQATLYQLMQPRCSRADVGRSSVKDQYNTKADDKKVQGTGMKHYAFFPGNPVWKTKRSLTYAFSPTLETTHVSLEDRRAAFASAFAQWSAIVPLTFAEISSYNDADIKIEFANGDHKDGQPFDGVLGILGHAFSPEDGRFHLDNAEYWTVDMNSEQSSFAMDLESVAVHEIGHLSGLGHSSTKDAIMFPSLTPREVKRQLVGDDIRGAQALYGTSKSSQGSNSFVHNTDETANAVSGTFCELWLHLLLLAIHFLASNLL